MELFSNPFVWALITAVIYFIVEFMSKKVSFFHIIPALLFLIPAYLFISQGSYLFFVSYIFFCIVTICLADMIVSLRNPFAAFFAGLLFGMPLIVSSILCIGFFIGGIVNHNKIEKLNGTEHKPFYK